MEQSNYTVQVLTASAGCYLTQKKTPEEPTAAVVTDKVYLAAGDSAENWREIDADEAAAIRAAREAAYRVATESAGDVGDVAQVEEAAVHGDEAGD